MKALCSLFLLIIGITLVSVGYVGNSIAGNHAASTDMPLASSGTNRSGTTIEQVLKWNRAHVVQAGKTFYGVNLENGVTVPLVCSENSTLIGFSTQPGKQDYALCRDNKGVSLVVRSKNEWTQL